MTRATRSRVRQQRVAAISAETLRLLYERGFEGLRVDEVAKRVGVAKGTLYLDVPSKEALVARAIMETGEELVEWLRGAIAEAPRERSLQAAVQAAARVLNDREEMTILLACEGPAGAAGAMQGPPCLPIRRFLIELVERQPGDLGQDRGGVDPELAAEALLGLLARPTWRRLVAAEGPEVALRRSGFSLLTDD